MVDISTKIAAPIAHAANIGYVNAESPFDVDNADSGRIVAMNAINPIAAEVCHAIMVPIFLFSLSVVLREIYFWCNRSGGIGRYASEC